MSYEDIVKKIMERAEQDAALHNRVGEFIRKLEEVGLTPPELLPVGLGQTATFRWPSGRVQASVVARDSRIFVYCSKGLKLHETDVAVSEIKKILEGK